MKRLYKSLLWAIVLEALALIILWTGGPSGRLHAYLFILLHFVPVVLSSVHPLFASTWAMIATQFLVWSVLVYFLYTAIEAHKNARGTNAWEGAACLVSLAAAVIALCFGGSSPLILSISLALSVLGVCFGFSYMRTWSSIHRNIVLTLLLVSAAAFYLVVLSPSR